MLFRSIIALLLPIKQNNEPVGRERERGEGRGKEGGEGEGEGEREKGREGETERGRGREGEMERESERVLDWVSYNFGCVSMEKFVHKMMILK